MNIIRMLVNQQQQHYLGLKEQTPSQLKEEKKAQLLFFLLRYEQQHYPA